MVNLLAEEVHLGACVRRFLTQDTYKGSAWAPWTQNLYVYVANNPVNYVDPTGHRIMTQRGLELFSKAVVWLDRKVYEWTGNSLSDWTLGCMPMCGEISVFVDEAVAYLRVVAAARAASGTAMTVLDQLSLLATQADRAVTGKGAVPGTLKHSAFRDMVNKLGNPLLKTEQSYLNGRLVPYGTKGAVRLDVVEFDAQGNIIAVYDLKTGSASLTAARIKEIQSNLPVSAQNVPVIQVTP